MFADIYKLSSLYVNLVIAYKPVKTEPVYNVILSETEKFQGSSEKNNIHKFTGLNKNICKTDFVFQSPNVFVFTDFTVLVLIECINGVSIRYIDFKRYYYNILFITHFFFLTTMKAIKAYVFQRKFSM